MKTQGFNPAVFEKLEEFGISTEEEVGAALLYLLSVFFELKCEVLPAEVVRTVNLTKIATRDYTDPEHPVTHWNIPLFMVQENLEQNWEWIADYRKLFSDVRPSAKGDLGTVVKKMKAYFAENPHVRKEDVMEAARNYIEEFRRSRSDSQYFQQADHFIRKNASRFGEAQSRLTNYLETIYEERKRNTETNTGNRFMQEMR